MSSSLARRERRKERLPRVGARNKRRTDPHEIVAPLILNLLPPTVEDMPVGATLRPGAMILHISTPPVLGEAKDENRFFRFPVYLPESYREQSRENTLLAFDLLSLDPAVRNAVDQLRGLARNDAARAYARDFLASRSV